MKFRKSFVTNSSSSSYICDICGAVESGFDCSVDDVGMYECVVGHIMCQDHLKQRKKDASIDDLLGTLHKNITRYNKLLQEDQTRDNTSYVEKWLTEAEGDLVIALSLNKDDGNDKYTIYDLCEKYDLNCNLPSSQCPICKMEVISRNNIIEYFLKNNNTDREKLALEVKEKFKSYDDLCEYLKNK